MSIGEKLRSLRKKLGLTQKEFASRIKGKVDYTYIGKVERGEQYPSVKMLERIAKSFSVPLSYFFEEESITGLLELFPEDIKNLLKDKRRQKLLRASERLDERDLSLLLRIIDVLVQTRKEPAVGVLEERRKYSTGEKDELISRIREILASPGVTVSLEESWVRKAFQIALSTLEGENSK